MPWMNWTICRLKAALRTRAPRRPRRLRPPQAPMTQPPPYSAAGAANTSPGVSRGPPPPYPGAQQPPGQAGTPTTSKVSQVAS